MVELKLTGPSTPLLFTSNGYRLVVMPMVTTEAASQTAEPEAQAEPETEAAPEPKAAAEKPKKAQKSASRAKEPVAAR
jgi:hypothetical protein